MNAESDEVLDATKALPTGSRRYSRLETLGRGRSEAEVIKIKIKIKGGD